MDRIKQATPATISNTWYSDGTIIDPGTVTVGVTAADGTVVVAPGTATSGGGAAARTFNLTAGHTAALNMLTATWTSSTQGTDTTVYEVAGDFLFTIAQARTALGDAAYDAAKVAEARTYAETELERALGFALVPRYATRTLWARRADRIKLRPFVRVIRSATIGGTPISAANIANLIYSPDGYVAGYSWWNGQVVVRYEHGMDPDNDLSSGARRAALSLAVEYLGGDVSGNGVDPRAERLVTDDGTIVYGAAAGGQFSVPDVNRWVTANGLPRTA